MRLLTLLFVAISICGFADFTLKDGKLIEREREEVSMLSVQEHYSVMLKAHEDKDWKKLEKESQFVLKNFPSTPFSTEATYFLGVAYFQLEDFEIANIQFTEYLTHQATPKYFEEAIQFKFEIAEGYRQGARKHLMGLKSMPKWAPSGNEAVTIYDEVISALPHHDLAAHALYGKAQVLGKNEDYRAAVESYQTLIRRFPKHPLSIESYIGIGEIYLSQSKSEYPDPDFLDLAELNLRKFRTAFPGEEKLSVAQQNYILMQEHYATALYDTARFYERTNKWGAAKIYYTKIIKGYPDSQLAQKSQERLEVVEIKLSKKQSKK